MGHPIDDDFAPATGNAIRGCIAFHDAEKAKADLYRDNAKAALEPLRKAHRLRLDAVKSAMRLRDLAPGDVRAWLDTFSTTVAALGLDAQLDPLDTVKTAQRLHDAGVRVTVNPPDHDPPDHDPPERPAGMGPEEANEVLRIWETQLEAKADAEAGAAEEEPERQEPRTKVSRTRQPNTGVYRREPIPA